MSSMACVMKCQSTILSCFSQLSAKWREVRIDDELGSISPTNCTKEQESVAGCNEDPGATNKTLSPELAEVSLNSINSGASSLEDLDLHVLSDSDQTPNPPCVLSLKTCCSAAGVSGQTVTAQRAAVSLNDFNPPYDLGDLCTFANQLSEIER